MNIRKNIDYSTMFAALEAALSAEMPQMKLCCELGRIVCSRPEKGAAVAAAEYLHSRFPDASGFSPRNLRRMREFYRMYEDTPELLALAMEISWTQNVVILEADMEPEERRWYLRAADRFGWPKTELQRKIDSDAHLEIQLDESEVPCYTECDSNELECTEHDQDTFSLPRQDVPNLKKEPYNECFCVLKSILPTVYQYFWRARLANYHTRMRGTIKWKNLKNIFSMNAMG